MRDAMTKELEDEHAELQGIAKMNNDGNAGGHHLCLEEKRLLRPIRGEVNTDFMNLVLQCFSSAASSSQGMQVNSSGNGGFMIDRRQRQQR